MLTRGQPPFLECSSKGDRRFSAFYAKPKSLQGRTIEEAYQGMKVLPDGRTGLSWKQAKGQRAVNADECAAAYDRWWCEWVYEQDLLPVLVNASGFSDTFGQEGHACQAEVLWRIRNGELTLTKDEHEDLKRNFRRLDSELRNVLAIVQSRLQPGGSPPLGGSGILVEWITANALENQARHVELIEQMKRFIEILADPEDQYAGVSGEVRRLCREFLNNLPEQTDVQKRVYSERQIAEEAIHFFMIPNWTLQIPVRLEDAVKRHIKNWPAAKER